MSIYTRSKGKNPRNSSRSYEKTILRARQEEKSQRVEAISSLGSFSSRSTVLDDPIVSKQKANLVDFHQPRTDLPLFPEVVENCRESHPMSQLVRGNKTSSAQTEAFAKTPLGQALRKSDAVYQRNSIQTLNDWSAFSGKSILFLGSGSSWSLKQWLSNDHAEALLVDSDEIEVANATERVCSWSLDGNVTCIQADAWCPDQYQKYPGEQYDLIVMMKSCGAILESDSSTGFASLVTLCYDKLLSPKGLLVLDVQARMEMLGTSSGTKRLSECGLDKTSLDVATWGRKYDDIVYNVDSVIDKHIHLYATVYRYYPCASSINGSNGWQHWKQYVIKKHVTKVALKSKNLPPMPEIASVVPIEFKSRNRDAGACKVLDQLLGKASKGIKLQPTEEAYSAYSENILLPKWDGTSGVVMLSQQRLTVVSMYGVVAFPIGLVWDGTTSWQAEIFHTQDGLICVLLGVMEGDGRLYDPTDYNLFCDSVSSLRGHLEKHGILFTGPEYLEAVDAEDMVTIKNPKGRSNRLPIDGVNVVHDGHSGEFYKSRTGYTLDISADQIETDLIEAQLMVQRAVNINFDPNHRVGEYSSVSSNSDDYHLARPRPDKQRGNHVTKLATDIYFSKEANHIPDWPLTIRSLYLRLRGFVFY